jgi:hypothetical protein
MVGMGMADMEMAGTGMAEMADAMARADTAGTVGKAVSLRCMAATVSRM